MNKTKTIKAGLMKLAIFFIITASILSFFVLGGIYSFRNNKPQTIVLDKALFDTTGVPEKNNFQVTKFNVSYPFYSTDILADGSLVFTSTNSRKSGEDVFILDPSNPDSPAISSININSSSVRVSPDRTMISCYDFNYGLQFIYDLETRKIIRKYSSLNFCAWLPDSSGFIAMDKDQVYIQYINKSEDTPDKVQHIIKYISLYEQVKSYTEQPIIRSPKVAQNIPWYVFEVSPEGDKLFFIDYYSTANTTLVILDIKSGGISTVPLYGFIGAIKPLNNGNILFAGNVDGYDGLFICDIKDKLVKKILNGNIYMFALSPDNKRIAYSIIKDKQPTELHLASLINERIYYNKTILSDNKYINYLGWNIHSDKLFMVNSKLGGSEIFEFTFEDE
jgi:Tol biopolymer transport system component